MNILKPCLQHWNTAQFSPAIKQALEELPSGSLPLEKATTQGGMVDDKNISVGILNMQTNAPYIQIKFSVFFTEIIGGCNCHDDPAEANVYCEMLAKLHKQSGETSFTLLDDD